MATCSEPAFLDVIAPGAHTTIQDLGRVGYLAVGVPPSGALDPFALRLANKLVGNPENAACLECVHTGAELKVNADGVRVALVGEGCTLEILDSGAGDIANGRSVLLKRDTKFRLSPLRGSACAYLAVHGGFAVEPCLGSLSTYTRGGFGGLAGRTLRTGDKIPLLKTEPSAGDDQQVVKTDFFDIGKEIIIRVVLGPQDDHFTKAGIETFLSKPFKISSTSDRMGARLDGDGIELTNFENFVSDGISTGAIQVPGSGQPIILLKDHQTSGGYPKIATVISADLPLLGRARIGTTLNFKAVDVTSAEAARREQEETFLLLLKKLRAFKDEAPINVEALYEENLIDGIVDALERGIPA
ncbi:MAG: biotin-dependent carboxyltransferase family protein [Pseudomonadota bacterium]